MMASYGLWPLVSFVVGSMLVFLGERVLGPGHDLRVPLSALGSIGVALPLALRSIQALKAKPGLKGALMSLTLYYGAGALGLGLYWSRFVFEEGGQLGVMVAALWPILWLVGLLPSIFMELSLHSMVGSAVIEGGRVRTSGRSGLAVALALCWLVALNYVADGTDVRFDLRSVKDLVPSEATKEMARNLPEAVTITLFFPPANEVAEAVDPYFESLAALSPNLSLDRMDRDVYPKRAKDMRVRANGTVVISKGDVHESLRLDEDMGKARRKLKSLDKDVQSRLAKVSRDKRMAYLVTGHGERSATPRSDDPTPGLRDLKRALESLNYGVKRLGLTEGLGNEVPKDATLVIIPGPTSPMLPVEEAAIRRYLEGGGAVMLMLDPEVESDPELSSLLGLLGLSVDLTPLVNEQKYVRLSGGVTDRGVLFSNRFMAHDSIRTLARLSTQMALVFPTSGSLQRIEGMPSPKDGGPDIKTTVRSLPGTFKDLDGDFQADEGEEAQVFDLIAAVTLPPLDDGRKGGRAIVTADVDLVADAVLRLNAGNQQWLVDSVRFLEDDLQLSGAIAEAEDVPLLHSRDEDQVLFYGTILGMPLLILGLGALGVWDRRRNQGEESR